jgi:hypothetical protein
MLTKLMKLLCFEFNFFEKLLKPLVNKIETKMKIKMFLFQIIISILNCLVFIY